MTFDEALACFDRVLNEYAKSDAAPEAVYQRGVTLYKSTGSPQALKEAYERLAAHYPASEWTKRRIRTGSSRKRAAIP